MKLNMKSIVKNSAEVKKGKLFSKVLLEKSKKLNKLLVELIKMRKNQNYAKKYQIKVIFKI